MYLRQDGPRQSDCINVCSQENRVDAHGLGVLDDDQKLNGVSGHAVLLLVLFDGDAAVGGNSFIMYLDDFLIVGNTIPESHMSILL